MLLLLLFYVAVLHAGEKADITVAADEIGIFRTIMEAIKSVPADNDGDFENSGFESLSHREILPQNWALFQLQGLICATFWPMFYRQCILFPANYTNIPGIRVICGPF